MTAEDIQAQIQSLKKLAMDNYVNGGDAMVECWEQNDWVMFVMEEGSNAENMLRTLMSVHREQYLAAQDY